MDVCGLLGESELCVCNGSENLVGESVNRIFVNVITLRQNKDTK
mgnify:CR=1 FL=1